MHANFEHVRKSQSFWWTTLIIVAILMFTLAGILWFWQKLPPVIPLFYSLPWGEEQLTSPLTLLFILLTTGVIFCLNTLIATFVYPVSPYYARILITGSLLFTLLAAVTIWKTLFLIT